MEVAKVVNSFFTEGVAKLLDIDGIFGVNSFIGRNGEIMLTVRFENKEALAAAKESLENILNTLRSTIVFREKTYVGVCSYQYEKSSVTTEVS